jgi:uncharacterized membrane protein
MQVDHALPDSTIRRYLPTAGVLLIAGLVLGTWWIYTPGGLLGKADAIGYAVCHRIDLRSFHMGVRQLPLCSRCSGMYLGTLLAMGYYLGLGRGKAGLNPARPLLIVLGVFGLAFAVDGLNSYLHFFPGAPGLYTPTNTLRLITGTLLGLGMGTVVFAGFNQTVWKDWRPEPVLRSFKELAGLLILAALLVLAILSGNDLILYPLALLSSLGVVVVLTCVYAMLALILVRRENRATHGYALVIPLAIGFTLAMLQISVIDLGRYLATSTWAGFSL